MRKRCIIMFIVALLFSSISFTFPAARNAYAALPERPAKVATSANPDEGTTLVLSDQKHVWSFGDSGLTGRSNSYSAATPQRVYFRNESAGVDHSNDIKDIGAGSEHFVALTESGYVWSWGENFYGMVGDGTTTSKYMPVQVKDSSGTLLSGVNEIAVGNYHTLALKNDHTLWAWGSDTRGQLGDSDLSTYSQQSSAVQVMLNSTTPLTNVKEIAAGESFSMALTYDGKLYTWGDNYFGKLGLGSDSYSYTVSYPVQIAGQGINDHQITHIFTNSSFSSVFYTTVSNAVYGWGDNTSGQLGNGDFVDYSHGEPPISSPIEITALRNRNVIDIVGGQQHTLVLTNEGSVLGMGTDVDGQLVHYSHNYDSSVYQVFTPVQLDSSLTSIKHISAGAYSSFAVTADGTLLSFGDNSGLQLGQPKLQIHDTNADGLDDITWRSYFDSNGDGYDDNYPYRVTRPLPAQSLVEQGYTISGTLKNIENGLPLANVSITMMSEEYGSLRTTTNSVGAYYFTNVQKGKHYIHVDESLSSYFNTAREIEIDVTSDFTTHDFNVEAYWVPRNLQFVDTNPNKNVISGTFHWDSPAPPVASARYKLYFVNDLGARVGIVGSSELYAPFLQVENLSVPSGAKYIKLFVLSEEPASPICKAECDTGSKIVINDMIVTPDQAVSGIEFLDHDLDIHELSGRIKLFPNSTVSAINKYMLFWTDSNGYPVGPMIKELLQGNELVVDLPQDYLIPDGALELTIYAFDKYDEKVGISSFILNDSTWEHLDYYLNHLKYKLDPTMNIWTVTEINRFIGNQTDINADGTFNQTDVNLMLLMVSTHRVFPLSS